MTFKVSIIMGLYNCEKTLDEAILSIFDQTYSKWKLILCDDGSTDLTYQIAKRYQEQYPEKIVLVRNERNMGLNYTLNHCLQYVDTEYVARMDGDDISHRERLEKQTAFLEQHSQYAIVATQMEHFDENGVWGCSSQNGEVDVRDLAKETPFCHGTCMVRFEAYQAVGGYTDDKKLLRVEDYDLWVKMFAAGFRGYNLPEPLYKMRDDRNATNRRKFQYRINEARVRIKAVQLLHLNPVNYLFVLRPLLVGLLPKSLYEYLHKKRVKARKDKGKYDT